MTNDEKDDVRVTIESEGFGYTFISKTSFPEIKDERFHELRQAFLKAAEELAGYVGVRL